MAHLVDVRALTDRLNDLAEGRLTVDRLVEELRGLPYEDLGDLKLDHQRELRTGAAEAVYGPGKTPAQAAAAAAALAARASGAVFVTRASREQADAVRELVRDATYSDRARLIVVRRAEAPSAGAQRVCVVTAGTSDLDVAEEASVTAAAMGMVVDVVSDVGVAGLHRVLDHRAALNAADCVIVVAGMEGALASAVAGLTPRPVVAVPTSVGYGASFGGLAALLGMMSSCAPGIAVVNIDNGFGAALVAHRALQASRRNAGDDPHSATVDEAAASAAHAAGR
jgi:pyridinium-3,5-biscarboxylic acid mononucleotide synthase